MWSDIIMHVWWLTTNKITIDRCGNNLSNTVAMTRHCDLFTAHRNLLYLLHTQTTLTHLTQHTANSNTILISTFTNKPQTKKCTIEVKRSMIVTPKCGKQNRKWCVHRQTNSTTNQLAIIEVLYSYVHFGRHCCGCWFTACLPVRCLYLKLTNLYIPCS